MHVGHDVAGDEMSDCKAVIVIGPTASGKTALAHGIAEAFYARHVSAELINLDAFQFYRGVSTGTAKPSAQEILQYNYHGIDLFEADARFDAQLFATLATESIRAIVARGAVPICVGGSGLYLRALLHGLDPLPGANAPLRAFLRRTATQLGWNELHATLCQLDPVRAAEVHPNDSVRIERALEIAFLTGKKPSEIRSRDAQLSSQSTRFPAFVIHVDAEDALLRERIVQRIPLMFAQGWLDEVRSLLKIYGLESLKTFQSMRAIGYPDVLDFMQTSLNVTKPTDELSKTIATRTWQYARRQRVWNAKEKKDCEYRLGDKVQQVLLQLSNWLGGMLLLLCCLASFVGCGSSKKQVDIPVNPIEVTPVRNGYTIVVKPFLVATPNVSIMIGVDSAALRWGGPALVPGVHWPVVGRRPTNLSQKKRGDAQWETLSSFEFPGGEISGVEELRYQVEWSSYDGFPVISGLVGAHSGTLMLNSFFRLLPERMDAPLRLWFLSNQGEALPLVAAASSCGVGCLSFSSYAEALDTPVSFSAASDQLSVVDYPERRLKIVAVDTSINGINTVSSEDGTAEKISDFLKVIGAKGGAFWDFYRAKWGSIEDPEQYIVHVMLTEPCFTQGLEHSKGFLAALGVSCGGRSENGALTGLLAHEMIHTWNVKRLFPVEHANPDFSKFTTARLQQEDFYEGFTDGMGKMTRVLLGGLSDDEHRRLLAEWNDAVVTSWNNIGVTLSAAINSNPWTAYKLGAVKSLHLAALSKKKWGQEEGSRRFFGILNRLAGTSQSIVSDGYGREQLLDAIGSAIDIPEWSGIRLSQWESGVPFPSAEVLQKMLDDIASVTGTSVGGAGYAKTFIEPATFSSLTWPL